MPTFLKLKIWICLQLCGFAQLLFQKAFASNICVQQAAATLAQSHEVFAKCLSPHCRKMLGWEGKWPKTTHHCSRAHAYSHGPIVKWVWAPAAPSKRSSAAMHAHCNWCLLPVSKIWTFLWCIQFFWPAFCSKIGAAHHLWQFPVGDVWWIWPAVCFLLHPLLIVTQKDSCRPCKPCYLHPACLNM